MPVQFPTLTIDEQIGRATNVAKETLIPYSYNLDLQLNTTGFPNVPVGYLSLTGQYFVIGMKADQNLGIQAITLNFSVTQVEPTGVPGQFYSFMLFELSYSPQIDASAIQTVTTPTAPTTPSDIGNVIYRNTYQNFVPLNGSGSPVSTAPEFITDYHRFTPDAYNLKFGQIIYFYILADNFTLANGGTIQGSVILHTLTTGAKT